jgi:hypothetical protein
MGKEALAYLHSDRAITHLLPVLPPRDHLLSGETGQGGTLTVNFETVLLVAIVRRNMIIYLFLFLQHQTGILLRPT